MGDIADWLAEQAMEGCPDEWFAEPRESIVCRHCGQRALWWHEQPEGWRLWCGNQPHRCGTAGVSKLARALRRRAQDAFSGAG